MMQSPKPSGDRFHTDDVCLQRFTFFCEEQSPQTEESGCRLKGGINL